MALTPPDDGCSGFGRYPNIKPRVFNYYLCAKGLFCPIGNILHLFSTSATPWIHSELEVDGLFVVLQAVLHLVWSHAQSFHCERQSVGVRAVQDLFRDSAWIRHRHAQTTRPSSGYKHLSANTWVSVCNTGVRQPHRVAPSSRPPRPSRENTPWTPNRALMSPGSLGGARIAAKKGGGARVN